jgi:hypothetical protein
MRSNHDKIQITASVHQDAVLALDAAAAVAETPKRGGILT